MFLTSNSNRGGLKAAPAVLIALLLLLATLPVYAGENEPHGMIDYRDGVLYVFHWDDAPARLYIPPELKVEGQEVAARTGKTPVLRGFEMEAHFKPATSGQYNFEPKKDIDFDLLVARLTGVGDVIYEIGGEKRIIHVNSNDQRQFDVKFPDFEIDYSSPYSVSASGNIKLTKVFTGKSNEERYENKDIWTYTADGGILDGTMTLKYVLPPGKSQGPMFTFPFCPGSASYWLSNLPGSEPKPDKTPPPETPPETNPGNFPGKRYLLLLVPAAAALLLLPFARQRVNVSVELELTESGAQAVVYRDARGPEKVRVVLNVNSRPFEQELILKHNESRAVDIKGIGYVQATIRTPGRRNISKNTRAELIVYKE